MAPPIEVQLKFGDPQGVAGVASQIRAQLIQEIGEETISRVRSRAPHPATYALRVAGVNQWSAEISGPRGGPGMIYPVRAKALRFVPKGGGVVYAKRVRGVGFGPLIEAEANRVESVNTSGIRVT